MKEPTAVMTAQYKVYNDKTRTYYTVNESGDSPMLTEISQSEPGSNSSTLVIENENLPKLIEALQRRYEDCKNDPESMPAH